MNEDVHYDAIVIGSGQGGSPLASALAASGMQTLIVEMRHVGGTCVNYGCTPTKTMVASARVAYLVGRSRDYGVLAGPDPARVDLERVRERKRNIVASFREGSEKHIADAENLSLLRGRARFVDAHTLRVQSQDGKEVSVEAPRVFINTGTRPVVPPVPGLGEVDYLDNETVMELARVPGHLIVVGGGYIGAEFGQMFRRFGARVTIVQRAAKLLPREDPEFSDAVAKIFRNEGIEVLTGAELTRVEAAGAAGSKRIRCTVSLHETKKVRSVEGSHLLIAAGRKPNSDDLGLERAGVRVDERGFIRVNDRLETGVDGIWALGDVKGGPAFTHISYDDFRILRKNVLEKGNASTTGRLVPYTVFIDPQLGHVGMTEREAKAAGRSIKSAVIPMSYVARALEVDETGGLMKAVVDGETDRILGFAMLGIDAAEISGAVQIAMMGDLPYTTLRDGVFTHPATLEALNTLFSGIS